MTDYQHTHTHTHTNAKFFKLWQQIPHQPISVPWPLPSPAPHGWIYFFSPPPAAGTSTVQADLGLSQVAQDQASHGRLHATAACTLEVGLAQSQHSMSSLKLQLRERHHHLPGCPPIVLHPAPSAPKSNPSPTPINSPCSPSASLQPLAPRMIPVSCSSRRAPSGIAEATSNCSPASSFSHVS